MYLFTNSDTLPHGFGKELTSEPHPWSVLTHYPCENPSMHREDALSC
jgi:hypothetical protein